MKKILQSLKDACRGIKMVALEEHSFQFHLIVGVAVIIVGMAIPVDNVQMMLLIIAVVLVLASEAANTAIEDLCNIVGPNPDPLIGKVKDISAGFVLISALGAIIIGLMVFWPYLASI